MSAQSLAAPTRITLEAALLDWLMPMHLWLDGKGRIRRSGATLTRLCDGTAPLGRHFSEVVEVRRPHSVSEIAELMSLDGCGMRLVLREHRDIALRGVVGLLPEGEGVLVNLALGMSGVEAAARAGLTMTDFAPTDQSVDLLYLIEANARVTAAWKEMSIRQRAARLAAEEQAFTDTLTGLKNRRALEAVMDRVTAPERPAPFAVMHVDLDYFKAVNDSLGHAAGDHVLHQVAHILRQETRSGDFVARLGGDEFVVVLRDCGDRVLVERIAGRILERLESPLRFDGQECRISASIGSTLSSHYRRLQSSRLLGDADRALYRSKHQGRGRHTIFQPET